MYICVCNGVTESEIRSSIEAGARSFGDLQRELGIASGCGQCTQETKCLLREARRECSFAGSLQAA